MRKHVVGQVYKSSLSGRNIAQYSFAQRLTTDYFKMAPVATHTMTEPPRGSLKLRQPVADPEAVARNRLPGPLSNLGLIEQYPVSLFHGY